MTPIRRFAPPRPVLLLLALMLTACAAPSTTFAPIEPTPPPPPPAAIASGTSVTDWQTYSQKVQSYLQKARRQAIDLLLPTPGCADTSPKSAECL